MVSSPYGKSYLGLFPWIEYFGILLQEVSLVHCPQQEVTLVHCPQQEVTLMHCPQREVTLVHCSQQK